MNGKALLETYPKAAKVIKQHFVDQLVNSLKDADLPEDFKEFARAQEIDNDKVGGLIDAQPRGLFDIFDNNGIYITTPVAAADGYFRWEINSEAEVYETSEYLDNRKMAEVAAVEKAFEILNNSI